MDIRKKVCCRIGLLCVATVVLGVAAARASDIYISDAWLQNDATKPTSKNLALYCEGLSSTSSFDIETCNDLVSALWNPIFRYSLGYGYGYGGSVGAYGYGYGGYVGGYGYGYGFQYSLEFGYGYGGGFVWSGNYTNASGRVYYRIKAQ